MKEHLTFKGIEYEECSGEEAIDEDLLLKKGYLRKGYMELIVKEGKSIYYKPVQKLPIIFQGEHYRFLIDDELKFYFCRNNKQYLYCSKSDIEANKKALEELERLKENERRKERKNG